MATKDIPDNYDLCAKTEKKSLETKETSLRIGTDGSGDEVIVDDPTVS